MPLRAPTDAELHELGERFQLELTDEEVEQFREVIAETIDAYETVREYDLGLGSPEQPRRERTSGHRPGATADPHNAWRTRCVISGTATGGPLDGWDLGIKDNIAVAGIEQTCGSTVLEGYAPAVDATVVSRVLDAGARIVGKTQMDDMAATIAGYSAFGAIRNPHDPNHLAGGSSAGSAVAVATRDADAALGTDQGGSIRIPAAHCGVVGHKPTYGLVPYTGCIGLERSVDHVGPIANSTRDVARLLSVIAGPDGRDPRQPYRDREPSDVSTGTDYEASLTGDVSTYSVAAIDEGFEGDDVNDAVAARCREALGRLTERGASVESVSLPMHADARDFHAVCMASGTVEATNGEGLGRGWRGWYDVDWVEAYGKMRRGAGDAFSSNFKLTLLQGALDDERRRGRFYAKAKNLCRELAARYDEVLGDHALVAMPTTPHTAPEYDREQEFDRDPQRQPNLRNTCAFNRTGHPAVTVPAGRVDGLPVGLMLVGSRFDDATVLNAAHAIEETGRSSSSNNR